MRTATVTLRRWTQGLERLQREMEHDSGERGPTKAENLVQYALEAVEADLKRAEEPPIDLVSGNEEEAG